MKRSEYTKANQNTWNKTAKVHEKYYFNKLLKNFKTPGYSTLDHIENEILVNQIDVKKKSIAQLCCNNGRELLSVKNLGAGRSIGFDISENYISQALEIVKQSGIECEFLQTDIYDISSEYDHQFDVIYITVGALGWMPDLNALFQVIKRLLKPSGWLFIYEMHPILDMFEPESKEENPLQIFHSYFRTPSDPYIDESSPDYLDKSVTIEGKTYWFHHKMSDIITACLEIGLQINSFKEYSHDISNTFAHFEKIDKKPPLCYSLVAQL